MTIDVLFIHSAGAQSGEQGSTPLVKRLQAGLGSGYRVLSPAMPAPNRPSWKNWKRELEKLLPDGSPLPILVGHSLGGSVLLKYLSERQPKLRVAGLFLVAVPYWGSKDWQVEEFMLRENFADFLPPGLAVYLYQSRDDEVVAADHLSRYAAAIPHATVRSLEGGGHAFQNGLPQLAEDIRAL